MFYDVLLFKLIAFTNSMQRRKACAPFSMCSLSRVELLVPPPPMLPMPNFQTVTWKQRGFQEVLGLLLPQRSREFPECTKVFQHVPTEYWTTAGLSSSRLRDGSKLLELQQEQLMVPLAPNLCETDLISELLGVTLGPKKAARKALIKNWCALWRPFASICPLDAVGAGNVPTCAVLLGFRVVNTRARGEASAFGTSFEILLQGNRLPFALSYFSRSSRVQGDWRKWSKKNQHDPNERVGLNWRTEGLLDFLIQYIAGCTDWLLWEKKMASSLQPQ